MRPLTDEDIDEYDLEHLLDAFYGLVAEAEAAFVPYLAHVYAAAVPDRVLGRRRG